MTRRKNKESSGIRQLNSQKQHWFKSMFAFLIASGVVSAILKLSYQYFMGNISLEFVQPVRKSYEFQLKNNTPADFTVKMLRVRPPRTQDVVYKITENIDVTINNEGNISLPGGNLIYVPAAEFKELDGQRLMANSSLKFIVPPLASRTWIEPEAIIVEVDYELEPSNSILSNTEWLLRTVGFESRVHNTRYLVIDNYWTVSFSNSINDAINIFCRDNEPLSNSSICESMH